MNLTPLDPADLFVMVGLVILAVGLYAIGGPWWIAIEAGGALIGLGVLILLRGGPRSRKRG